MFYSTSEDDNFNSSWLLCRHISNSLNMTHLTLLDLALSPSSVSFLVISYFILSCPAILINSVPGLYSFAHAVPRSDNRLPFCLFSLILRLCNSAPVVPPPGSFLWGHGGSFALLSTGESFAYLLTAVNYCITSLIRLDINWLGESLKTETKSSSSLFSQSLVQCQA